MIRLRSARWRGRLTARRLWNDPLSTLMRSSTPVAPERRAPSAISPRVGRRDDECLASSTSAARVASLENVTHLPQKDRTAFPADAVSDCGTRRVPVGASARPRLRQRPRARVEHGRVPIRDMGLGGPASLAGLAPSRASPALGRAGASFRAAGRGRGDCSVMPALGGDPLDLDLGGRIASFSPRARRRRSPAPSGGGHGH